MDAPKLISPLLDGYMMGEPISNHHGVQSCPALRADTEERYIVKIVSIPPSQNQLEALLLSGAFADEQAALSYFKDLSDDVCKEATILSRLSKLEGFLPFQSSQTIKMTGRCGYQVYLLSPYRRSVEKQMRTDPLTHLDAVNLGLDMCAALAVCRKAGFLYVNLKPENIYLSDMRGYCIGDLGFISLSSVKYASLPEKYRSRYTPPEINDAYAALSDNVDIYALGLVLYQVFNNGVLPEMDNAPMPVPMYADYEMAAIIMKACAPNPQDRWASPEEMGQALVDYMQRNAVDNVPIVPTPVIEETPIEEEPEEFLSEEENDQELAQLLAMIPDEEPPAEESPVEEPASVENDQSSEEESELQNTELDADTASEEAISPEEAPVEESSDLITSPREDSLQNDTTTSDDSEVCESEESQENEADAELSPEEAEHAETTPEEAEHAETTPEEVIEMQIPPQETAVDNSSEDCAEPVPEEPAYPRTELTEDGVTCEVAEMLAQADELLLMELPEPVVAPDPIDVPIPPPIVLDPEPVAVSEEIAEPTADAEEPDSQQQDTPEPIVSDAPENVPEEVTEEESEEAPLVTAEPEQRKKVVGYIVGGLIALILLAAAFVFGNHYYKNVYLQTVNYMEITGSGNEIVVQVGVDFDESMLTVVCTDTYGNTFRAPLTDGYAYFKELKYSTRYALTLEISGFHKLKGNISGSYTTTTQTEILNFQISPGTEDGSVNISFTVNGPNSNAWQLQYSAPGMEPDSIYFTGTHTTLSQLTVGTEYTFQLLPTENLSILEGTNVTTYTPQKNAYAKDITIASYADGVLVLEWSVPDGATAALWNIRCFNNNSFDLEFTSDVPTCSIKELDPTASYTVQITAEGMLQSEEIIINANPINVTEFHTTIEVWNLTVTWDFVGNAPKEGWTLICHPTDGEPFTVLCESNQATIPVLPQQSFDFQLCLQNPADGVLFAEDYHIKKVSMPPYVGHNIVAENVSFTLYETPTKENWGLNDLLAQSPSSTMQAGGSATILMELSQRYAEDKEMMTTTFVIIGNNNQLISAETSTQTWEAMWKNYRSVATLPSTPATPGDYTLCIYLNDALLGTTSFTIT